MKHLHRGAILAAGAILATSLLAPTRAATITNKVEVQRVDVGHVLGQPGVKVRLTLQTREALEYRIEDAAETASVLAMVEIFLRGNVRMFAEVEGSTVRAVQLSGPLLTAASSSSGPN
jgi:hypothetical protein